MGLDTDDTGTCSGSGRDVRDGRCDIRQQLESADRGFSAGSVAESPAAGPSVYSSEAQALAHLDELRAQRERIKREDAAVMAEIRSAVRAAAATVVEGEPLNRSTIIDRSGLSRRTVYQILDDKQVPDDKPSAGCDQRG